MRIHLLAAAAVKAVGPVAPTSRFVAVGGNTIRLFATDGSVEETKPHASWAFVDVAIGNDMIVAVSNSTQQVAYKPLVGGSWTIKSVPNAISTAWRAVVFLDGRFYLFGNGPTATTRLMSTADCVTWDVISLSDSANEVYFKMSSFNGKLLVPTRDINRVKSIDPVSKVITQHDANFGGSNYYPFAFKVVNGKPFALGQGRKISVGTIVGGVIQPDLLLKVSGGGVTAHVRDVEYSPSLGLYVAVGTSGSGQGTAPVMYTSPDAETWTLSATIASKVGAAVGIQSILCLGGDLYMGCNNGKIMKTSDLVNFTEFSTFPAEVFNIKQY